MSSRESGISANVADILIKKLRDKRAQARELRIPPPTPTKQPSVRYSPELSVELQPGNETLDAMKQKLGVIDTCFPSYQAPPDTPETIEFPETYRTLSSKEKLVLLFAENFRRQYREKFPNRQPLVLAPVNECGVQKFVCTTLRPSVLLFPDLIGSWQDIAAFVADYIVYEPLVNQVNMLPFGTELDAVEQVLELHHLHGGHVRVAAGFEPLQELFTVFDGFDRVADVRNGYRSHHQCRCRLVIGIVRCFALGIVTIEVRRWRRTSGVTLLHHHGQQGWWRCGGRSCTTSRGTTIVTVATEKDVIQRFLRFDQLRRRAAATFQSTSRFRVLFGDIFAIFFILWCIVLLVVFVYTLRRCTTGPLAFCTLQILLLFVVVLLETFRIGRGCFHDHCRSVSFNITFLARQSSRFFLIHTLLGTFRAGHHSMFGATTVPRSLSTHRGRRHRRCRRRTAGWIVMISRTPFISIPDRISILATTGVMVGQIFRLCVTIVLSSCTSRSSAHVQIHRFVLEMGAQMVVQMVMVVIVERIDRTRGRALLVPAPPPPPPAAPPGISEAPNVLYHCQNQDEFFVSSGVSDGADDGGVGCGVLTSGGPTSGGGGVCGVCAADEPSVVCPWLGDPAPVAVSPIGGGGVGGLWLVARGSDE
uniref:Uncharacterized protein n=1 Tax=Anopheles farauti TaxID=69004 RepID=A0A182QJG2_9DIPT